MQIETRKVSDLQPYVNNPRKNDKAIERDVDYNKDTILQGDAKTQVTVDLDEEMPGGTLHGIVVSVCHSNKASLKTVTKYVASLLKSNRIEIPSDKLMVNPGGEWTVGGPTADCGLTGRKIVCDQYGGYTPVGGGAFSGKDPTKVDRSAAYMARHLAKFVVKKLGAAHCLIQLGYVIGKTEPVSVEVSTGDKTLDELASKTISENFDLRPKAIIDRLDLLNADYERIAEGCHYYGVDW